MEAKIYTVNGKNIELYPIGALGYTLGRQGQTIKKWEKDGIIPPALVRSTAGRRLYTKAQIDAIAEVVTRFNIRQGSHIPDEFKDAVYTAFQNASRKLQST
jgi:hypothetical protein